MLTREKFIERYGSDAVTLLDAMSRSQLALLRESLKVVLDLDLSLEEAGKGYSPSDREAVERFLYASFN